MREIIINRNDADQRLDKFISKRFKSMPAALMYKYIRKKCIKVNGKKCEISTRLREGDVVTLYIKDEFFDEQQYDKALDIMRQRPDGTLEEAVTYLNIANTVEFELGLEQGESRINELLDKAYDLLIIDEYPYLKQTKKKNEVDSYMQAIVDRLPENVKIILCGSYITTMKELLTEDNPLFGRFSLIQHIHDFDYYEASSFYPELAVRDKIAYYGVFGGCPYVLENLDTEKTLKENIVRLILPETGLIRSHIENVMLKEIQKSFDARILESLANGKKKYTEIRDQMGSSETGLLDKQLKILLDMETIQKIEPINRRNDKKKQFYEITDNLMRFYFSFIFGAAGTISRIGEEQYYNRKIESILGQFVSRRLEGIAMQFFHRMALQGKYPDIEDFGSYWYDDPETKTNGEFDCVIKRSGNLYDFYECKYFDRPMKLEECVKEQKQLQRIKGLEVSSVGFICSGGFEFKNEQGFILIDGNLLYQKN